jgi:PAS domain S-box-containing protein
MSEQQWHRFWELAIDLKCVASLSGYFLVVNPAFERVLGYSEAELLGTPFIDFVHPDDRPATLAEVENLADGASVISFQNRYRTKDGRWLWLDWASRPVPEEGLIYATGRDVSTQKAMQAELMQRAAELVAVNEELKAFSYSVSHDLRAPLRAIDGFSEALLRDYQDVLDARGRDRLQRVRAGAQRMGALIDDLLQLSRTTRAEMKTTEVNLSELVESIVDELRRAEPERKVVVVVTPGVVAEADPVLIRAVLQNLCQNAWKFTARHGEARIEFGERYEGGERSFYVRDDGAGFDMEYAGKLFGAFQRLHSQAEFPGNGVGLATVKRIVRRHGGRIWAEGAIEGGATFSFTLEGPQELREAA